MRVRLLVAALFVITTALNTTVASAINPPDGFKDIVKAGVRPSDSEFQTVRQAVEVFNKKTRIPLDVTTTQVAPLPVGVLMKDLVGTITYWVGHLKPGMIIVQQFTWGEDGDQEPFTLPGVLKTSEEGNFLLAVQQGYLQGLWHDNRTGRDPEVNILVFDPTSRTVSRVKTTTDYWWGTPEGIGEIKRDNARGILSISGEFQPGTAVWADTHKIPAEAIHVSSENLEVNLGKLSEDLNLNTGNIIFSVVTPTGQCDSLRYRVPRR